MTEPTIRNPGTPPSRSQNQPDFDETGYEYLGDFNTACLDINVAIPWIAARVNDASDSADTATTKAGEASDSADTATTKAGEASDSADTATTKAGEASDSADEAATSLNDILSRHLGNYADDAAADAAHPSAGDGTFYFKTTAPKGLRLRLDGAWTVGVIDTDGALVAANNLSDLTDPEAARDNLGVFADVLVRTPDNLSPANAATDVSNLGPLVSEPYGSLYERPHIASQWQISEASDFATTVLDTGDVTSLETYTIPLYTLETNTEYYWRVRHKDYDGTYSEWSDGTSFTTSTVFYPDAEVASLAADDVAASDFFGDAVSVSGNYAIAGAYQDDDDGSGSGSAYIFERDDEGTWSQAQKLTASDAAGGDSFGIAVAISGTYAVVGAPGESSNAGKIYVFERNGAGVWEEVADISASDAATADSFGEAVAIDGDRIIVGAKGESSGRGKAYIIKRDGAGTWSEVDTIVASDGASSDQFGVSVAISGATAVVGASGDNTLRGAAYVFDGDGSEVWTQTIKLTASDGGSVNYFGYSVGIDGSDIVVGAYSAGGSKGKVYFYELDGTWSEIEDIAVSDGASGDQLGWSVSISGVYAFAGARADDDDGSGSGSVYAFGKTELGGWEELGKITASDASASDQFGTSVSASGGYLAVGAINAGTGGQFYIYE